MQINWWIFPRINNLATNFGTWCKTVLRVQTEVKVFDFADDIALVNTAKHRKYISDGPTSRISLLPTRRRVNSALARVIWNLEGALQNIKVLLANVVSRDVNLNKLNGDGDVQKVCSFRHFLRSCDATMEQKPQYGIDEDHGPIEN